MHSAFHYQSSSTPESKATFRTIQFYLQFLFSRHHQPDCPISRNDSDYGRTFPDKLTSQDFTKLRLICICCFIFCYCFIRPFDVSLHFYIVYFAPFKTLLTFKILFLFPHFLCWGVWMKRSSDDSFSFCSIFVSPRSICILLLSED